jgi:hypothetical protein
MGRGVECGAQDSVRSWGVGCLTKPPKRPPKTPPPPQTNLHALDAELQQLLLLLAGQHAGAVGAGLVEVGLCGWGCLDWVLGWLRVGLGGGCFRGSWGRSR